MPLQKSRKLLHFAVHLTLINLFELNNYKIASLIGNYFVPLQNFILSNYGVD